MFMKIRHLGNDYHYHSEKRASVSLGFDSQEHYFIFSMQKTCMVQDRDQNPWIPQWNCSLQPRSPNLE